MTYKNITSLCKKKKSGGGGVKHIKCCTLMEKNLVDVYTYVCLYFTELFRPVCSEIILICLIPL